MKMKFAIPFLIFSVLFISVFCTGCDTAPREQQPDSLSVYSVISDSEFGVGNTNREVAVRLEKPATEAELTVIANEIKTKKRKSYERTNVHFYLPGMEVGSGAWAIGNFNPDLNVKILGD